ncbi:MAG TPA: hypothetical protein VIM57_04865 [Luteolibacter sp.]
MSGIRLSEAALWCACWLGGVALADEVLLEGDSRLAGSVSAIAENGTIMLETPLSPEPLALRGEAVRSVSFSKRPESTVRGDTLLTLANGDVLPGEIRSLDADHLTLATSFAGELPIPRAMISRLTLGVAANRVIYDGPTTLEGWGAEQWIYQDNTFASQTSGRLAKAFDLPEQFILRFHLAWKNNPSLQVAFAEASGDPKSDRYLFQFTNGGIEIKRYQAAEQKLVSLTTLSRSTDQFPQSEMDVEIRVDRKEAKLQLWIDSQLEARIDDPVGHPPGGGGISFRSNVGGEGTHRISKIQILGWDAEGERHRTEERGDPKTDALIDSEGGRYSGRLESIAIHAGVPSLRFKSPLLDKPMEIPATEVSTVFFATPQSLDAAKPSLVLKVHGGGELHVESCRFANDRITARHPLLGELTLNRNALVAVERPSVPPKNAGRE